MNEQEPKIDNQGPEVPDSYLKDKERAEWMAEVEDDLQEALSIKLRGEDIEGKTISQSADELRDIIEKTGQHSSDTYDTFKKNEKEARVDDYIQEHPHAVVDEDEAMEMAQATKPEEEEILRLKKSAASELGQVGLLSAGYLDNDPHLSNAEEYAKRAEKLREVAEAKATRVSNVYKSINKT